jgi:thiamine-monophosphate kinase
MEKLADIGEREAIRRLTAGLGGHPLLRTGVGDDCAVTKLPGTGLDQVFTTDPLIEGIHFESGEQPGRIGAKAAGRVLSDLAAMGAEPRWLLVNLVASPDQDIRMLEQVYAGMTALGSRYGAVLIGGDLARGPGLELHVFGAGTVPAGTALLRSGARQGDALFVTGALGCSLRGRHLDFEPRVQEGIFLRELGAVTAMMDISDGLATDLRHILDAGGVGALLDAERIPKNGSLAQALFDGEDYELLFSVPENRADELCARWRERFETDLFMIGRITAEPGIMAIRENGQVRPLAERAFEHFSDRPQDRPDG